MAVLPVLTVGRRAAIVWLLASSGLLLFAWQQQHIHDMPEVFIWLMIFLTMPIGFPVIVVVGVATSAIEASFGITYHPFWNLLPVWLMGTASGYVQWFVLLPTLWRKFRVPRAI